MNYETRPITKDEYIEIIQTLRTGFLNHRPNAKVAMALVLEANIGIRISDITEFTLDKTIKEGDKYRLNLVEQKTGKQRSFTIPNELMQFIKQYCIDNNIKSNERIINITERAVQKQLDFVCDYLGLQNVSTHSFRKFFSHNLYDNNGEDIRIVQQALQHSSIETTMKYLKVDRSTVDKALENNVYIVWPGAMLQVYY